MVKHFSTLNAGNGQGHLVKFDRMHDN